MLLIVVTTFLRHVLDLKDTKVWELESQQGRAVPIGAMNISRQKWNLQDQEAEGTYVDTATMSIPITHIIHTGGLGPLVERVIEEIGHRSLNSKSSHLDRVHAYVDTTFIAIMPIIDGLQQDIAGTIEKSVMHARGPGCGGGDSLGYRGPGRGEFGE